MLVWFWIKIYKGLTHLCLISRNEIVQETRDEIEKFIAEMEKDQDL